MDKKKLRRYLPMTRKEQREVLQCYATAFPDWKVIADGRLVRYHGPIMQQIGFEALRGWSYRPAAVIRALPLPTVRMLDQLLDIKRGGSIGMRDHPRQWKDVVVAMEQQFRPSVRKPLDLREVTELCKHEVLERTNDLCMLAILNAYLGENEQALSYCERIQAAPLPTLPPPLKASPAWERQRREFGLRLKEAIEQGKAREFLEWEQSEWERGNKKM